MNSGVVEISMTYFLLAGVVLVVWATVFITTRRKMQAEIEQLRSMIYEHLQKERETKPLAAPVPAPLPAPAKEPVIQAPVAAPAPVPTQPEEVTHETLAIISAAIAAYLGKTVRIRSARRLSPDERSTWAQQGRVYIQASHNLGMSHHG
jgi:methylmalonyl-CoA carboxyltransferase large subunit